MAYTALYRKWRPDTFDGVRGQDAIVTTLRNQVASGRIGHAYLFCGTRGTGKTSVAKIFARAVNCEHPENGNPCGECPSCRAIAANASMCVAEIDAASNNSVDNVREIRSQVQYPPADGKYRVYIIDEVHMLSTGAFNALLKTLEEPPAYVIFILATTEIHKVPATILSRCQRYDFRRISTAVIAKHLQELAKAEQIDAEDRALRYVAKAADGSMRDGLSLLDQCVAFHVGEKLTYQGVLDVLGAADNTVFSDLFRMVAQEDTAGALSVIDEMVMKGRDLRQMVSDFIWYMRNLLLYMTAENAVSILDLPEEYLALFEEEAAMVSVSTLSRYIRVMSDLENSLRQASQKRVLTEVAFIRLTKPAMEQDIASVNQRVESLEKQMGRLPQLVEQLVPAFPAAGAKAPAEGENGTQQNPAGGQDNKKKQETLSLPAAEYDDLLKIRDNWGKILDRLSHGGQGSGKALEGTFVKPDGDGRMRVVFQSKLFYDVINRKSRLEELSQAAAEICGKAVEFIPEYKPGAGVDDVIYIREKDKEFAAKFPGVPVEVNDDKTDDPWGT